MARNWISFPRNEGEASRQAHCDLPPGTFERELGREGFFGPATHMYHRHRPTDWLRFEGDLKPRAYDTSLLVEFGPSPWDAFDLLHNGSTRIRSWALRGSMDHLVRNADGDELLFFGSRIIVTLTDDRIVLDVRLEASAYVTQPPQEPDATAADAGSNAVVCFSNSMGRLKKDAALKNQ